MEAIIRISIAVSIFGLMVSWEFLQPRRTLVYQRMLRWRVNLGLAAFNMLCMRLSIGALAYLAAIDASNNHWGLLNWLDSPYWLSIIISLLVLDLAVYGQHVLFHKWPLLWRLHQVHHTDLDFDTTTAVRFHPLEILLSMLYKTACVYALGANPIAVIAFEVILSSAALFNHSNITLPKLIDNTLRWLIVTPDMHRIHHSTIHTEMDSNYGFSLSLWDRLFKTYTHTPSMPQTTMLLGLESARKISTLGFLALLRLPFKKSLR